MAEARKEILIFNQARMGDLLECLPLIGKIKGNDPAARVTLALLPGFEKIASLLPGVDAVLRFDEDGLKSALKGCADWISALPVLEDFLGSLCRFHFHEAYNLVYSRNGALILRAMKVGRVHGLKFESNGFFSLSDPWAAYLWNFMSFVETNPFNLTDLYRHLGGRDGSTSRCSIRKPGLNMARLRKKFGLAHDTAFIALQPGCNSPDRRVDARILAQAARLTATELKIPVLVLGAPGEKETVDQATALIGENGRPGISDLDELTTLLDHCALLITNDTGPMHLAAAVGSPILLICSGCSNPQVSGPYREGAYALKPALPCHPCRPHAICGDMPCRSAISPATIAAAAHWIAAPRNAKTPPPKFEDADFCVFKKDAWDFLRVYPASPERIRSEEWFRELWHFFWNSLTAPASCPVDLATFLSGLRDNYRFTASAEIVEQTRIFREQAIRLSQTLATAQALIGGELALIKNQPQALRSRFPAIKEALIRLESEVGRQKEECSWLSPYLQMFGHQKDHIHFSDPLASLSALCDLFLRYGQTLVKTVRAADEGLGAMQPAPLSEKSL